MGGPTKRAPRRRTTARTRAAEVVEELRARTRRAGRRLSKIRKIEASWNALEDRSTPEALDIVADWIAAQLARIGAKGGILGVSGGVDSSLVTVLLARAGLPDNMAFIMPCRGDPADEEDARALLDLLEMPYRVIDIAPLVDAALAASGTSERGRGRQRVQRVAVGNLASRFRNDLLYYEANRSRRLVIGTGDFDETYIGYSSKGTTSDLFPITGLHKHEVRALLLAGLEPLDAKLARRLANKPASPGYWRGQNAERELGISYPRLAAALDVLVGQCDIDARGVRPWDDKELVEVIVRSKVPAADLLSVAELVAKNHHKAFGSPALWRPEPHAGQDSDLGQREG